MVIISGPGHHSAGTRELQRQKDVVNSTRKRGKGDPISTITREVEGTPSQPSKPGKSYIDITSKSESLNLGRENTRAVKFC